MLLVITSFVFFLLDGDNRSIIYLFCHPCPHSSALPPLSLTRQERTKWVAAMSVLPSSNPPGWSVCSALLILTVLLPEAKADFLHNTTTQSNGGGSQCGEYTNQVLTINTPGGSSLHPSFTSEMCHLCAVSALQGSGRMFLADPSPNLVNIYTFILSNAN